MYGCDDSVKKCLNVSAWEVKKPLKVTASLSCSVSSTFTALMVDEGFLIVELNNEDAYLFVKKK